MIFQIARVFYRSLWGEKYAGESTIATVLGDALLSFVGIAFAEALFVSTSITRGDHIFFLEMFKTDNTFVLFDMIKAGCTTALGFLLSRLLLQHPIEVMLESRSGGRTVSDEVHTRRLSCRVSVDIEGSSYGTLPSGSLLYDPEVISGL